MATKSILLASLLCIAAAPALADPLPTIAPDHDFSGTYLITQSDGAKPATVQYSAAARAARIDVSGSQGYVIIDFRTHDFKMVMPAQRAYMDMASLAAQGRLLMGPIKAGAAPNPTTPPAAPPEIQNLGTETIAGRTCSLTKITDTSDGTWTEICTTPNGIILHIRTDKGDDVTAQSISEASVPLSAVEIPPGYTPFVIPGLPPGMTLPGGMTLPPGISLPPGITTPSPPPGQ